jgi:hypothetical protein
MIAPTHPSFEAARDLVPGLAPTPLLPAGYVVPASRWEHPSTRMRRLLETEP